MPYTNPFGMVYDSGEYHDCMARVLRLGDWQGFPARRAEAKSRGRLRGIGVANYVDTATGAPREKAEMVVKPEGIVEVAIGTVSQGQGHETSFAQLVTEFLGVPLDSIRLITGDTARVSVGGGAHSGRALRLGSIVMLNASKAIVEKGLQIASHVLEADVADLEFVAGNFTVKGTDRAIGIFEVARRGAASATTCPTICAGRSAPRATRPSTSPPSPMAAMSARSRSTPRPGCSTSCATARSTMSGARSTR